MKCRKVDWTNLDCLARPLSRFFERYARYVSRHPWPFIVFPVLVSAALSVGFLHKNEITDAMYLYTPIGSQSKYERQSFHEKWPVLNGRYIPGKAVTALRECQCIVSARDEGNVLRPDIAQAIIRLNLYIIDRIKVTYDGVTYGYRDLCLLNTDATCNTNPQVGLISTLFNNPVPSLANLTFPIAQFGTQPVYLASSLGNVTVNATRYLQSAKAWMLLYQLQFSPDNVSYVSGLWEMQYQKEMLEYVDPFLTISIMHSQTLSNELKRNAEHLAPRFVLCFIILITFATLCTGAIVHHAGFPYVDWVMSKPFLATAGVVGAGLGVAAAIGLLNFCGAYYNQIVLVMPFLVISVRLDNTFLMISAVRHTSRNLPVGERMGEAMSEAAVSITVTVLTDVLSFAVGLTANIPAVKIFCLYTTVAILLSFFCQLTFLMGLLVVALRMEEKGKHMMLFFVDTIPSTEAKSRTLFERLFMLGSRADKNTSIEDGVDKDWMSYMFLHWFGPVLVHPVMKAVVMIWFMLYLGLAGWACSQVRQGLEPVNLLVSDSYAIPHYRGLENYFWSYGSEAQICVNNAPNLSIPLEKENIFNMVKDFGTNVHSIGMEGVQFWLFEFENFLKKWNLPSISNLAPKDFYLAVYHFLALNSFERYRQDVKWDIDGDINDFYANYTGEKLPRMTSFRFSIGLRNFQTAMLQIETVNMLRDVADKYPQYNITTFNPVWMFVDQYQQIWPNVWQEVLGGTCFMILIALFLIPHPICSLFVAVVILSVDLGVIGFMTVWGIRLDTVSMITIIMSIGFSVDFAAHTAHAYVSNNDLPPEQRIPAALGSIGWPSLQGGLSTVLGVVVLSDLDSYMIVAFFKTVFLVIVLAVIHGLVFLPVLLSIFVPHKCESYHNSKKDNRMPTSPMPATVFQNCYIPNATVVRRIPAESNGSLISNGHHRSLNSSGQSIVDSYPVQNGLCSSYPSYVNGAFANSEVDFAVPHVNNLNFSGTEMVHRHLDVSAASSNNSRSNNCNNSN